MSTPPLCTGCIHHHIEKNEALCTRKYVLNSTDHSTGQQFKRFTFCTTCSYERSRIAPWACGKKGRHFKAKEGE